MVCRNVRLFVALGMATFMELICIFRSCNRSQKVKQGLEKLVEGDSMRKASITSHKTYNLGRITQSALNLSLFTAKVV